MLVLIVFLLDAAIRDHPVEEGCRRQLLGVADDHDLARTRDGAERILRTHLRGLIDDEEIELHRSGWKELGDRNRAHERNGLDLLQNRPCFRDKPADRLVTPLLADLRSDGAHGAHATARDATQVAASDHARSGRKAVLLPLRKLADKNGKINKAVLKLPLRDGDTERPDDPVYAGHYFVNANASESYPPKVFDAALNPIMDRNEFYSGCYARASLTFYAFSASGNKGIAAGLNGLQKVADGEPLGGGGNVEADFDDDFEIEDDILG